MYFLIPILAKSWKVSLEQLRDILEKYDLLNYIDICYEAFNSMGNQGIIDELEEYIEIQGVKLDGLFYNYIISIIVFC